MTDNHYEFVMPLDQVTVGMLRDLLAELDSENVPDDLEGELRFERVVGLPVSPVLFFKLPTIHRDLPQQPDPAADIRQHLRQAHGYSAAMTPGTAQEGHAAHYHEHRFNAAAFDHPHPPELLPAHGNPRKRRQASRQDRLREHLATAHGLVNIDNLTEAELDDLHNWHHFGQHVRYYHHHASDMHPHPPEHVPGT